MSWNFPRGKMENYQGQSRVMLYQTVHLHNLLIKLFLKSLLGPSFLLQYSITRICLLMSHISDISPLNPCKKKEA